MKGKTHLPINVLARYGICLSLRDNTIPNVDIYDENGMDLPLHVLFGEYDQIFDVIMRQRLEDDKLDYEKYSDRMLRAHLNRGAGMLHPRINDLDDFSKLMEVR
ncbi:MAG: DNA sulfur modification protein DndE [Cenarchaeum symbiont of Oopsacas minuta]|nr:DNA sulfur modification protein DndE [Cenarchaeum symbiont of Oopsacas minuta]